MSGFEDYGRNIKEIELQIERKGVALGIDWTDERQVRALARAALEYKAEDDKLADAQDNYAHKAMVDLFGLASLMLQTMEESASIGIESHGGEVWKSFGRALWNEHNLRKTT